VQPPHPPTFQVERYTELLVRQLHAKHPRAALLWLTAAWRDYGPNAAPPYHRCAEDGQGDVLRWARAARMDEITRAPGLKKRGGVGASLDGLFLQSCGPASLASQVKLLLSP
jgi:hypothetical protein